MLKENQVILCMEMQAIFIWRDCWIPSKELGLPKGKKSQNCLNITPSFKILHCSELATYLQQMLSHFQIVICQRSIRSGKDSVDLQSNTTVFDTICICRYKNTHTQIHEGLHTHLYTHIYLSFYIFYLCTSEKTLIIIWL